MVRVNSLDPPTLAEGFGAGGEQWTLTAQPSRGREDLPSLAR